MNIILALYLFGLVFHAYCAYVEIRFHDRGGRRVTLFEHLSAIVRLILWPIIPLTILYDFYTHTLASYAEPETPDN